jgi:flagellar biosynthetic protein FliQ
MLYQQYATIGRETLISVLFATGPILITALLVGLLIGIFQAATSINESTLTFVPKLIIVLGVLAVAGPFMMSTMTGFFFSIFTEISRVGR